MSRSVKALAFGYYYEDNFGQPELENFAELCWGRLNCDELPIGLDYFLFDCAANVDIDVTIKWLQHVLGRPESRHVDRGTLAAVDAMPTAELISGIEMAWRRRLKSLPQWPEQSNAWSLHINHVRARSLKMMKGAQRAEAS